MSEEPTDYDLGDLGRNPSSIALAEATTPELAEEFARRFISSVTLGLSVTDDEECMSTCFRGGRFTAIGMCARFIQDQTQD